MSTPVPSPARPPPPRTEPGAGEASSGARDASSGARLSPGDGLRRPGPPSGLQRLWAPADIAALVWLRVAFGLLMAVAAARSLATGWVDELLVRPTFFFKYPGLAWVPVPEPAVLYGLEVLQVLAGLGIALGLYFRLSLALFWLSFFWVQVMDLTNYLNHYYFVLLLLGLLGLTPAHGALSVDAWRNPSLRRSTVPTWMIWLLRFQVAMVYLHAGIAKIGADWLLHGQPLSTWMASRGELPLLGPLLTLPHTGLVMSWAGCLYDCTIVGFLLWRRTRALAYTAVLVFHLFTHLLFDIGLFPFIMVLVTPIFFAPDWPRRALARLGAAPGIGRRIGRGIGAAARAVLRSLGPAPALGAGSLAEGAAQGSAPARLTARRRLGLTLGAVWVVFHLVFPQRWLLWGGNLLWHEQGMRYSWRVMLREKHGAVTFRVQVPGRARPYEVNPLDYLQPRQYSEMSSQPDLMVQLAHHIRDDLRRRGLGDGAVYLDTRVSLNGRPGVPLIDPTVDVTRIDPRRLDRIILPAPLGPPLRRGVAP